jgi:hypothetical protein
MDEGEKEWIIAVVDCEEERKPRQTWLEKGMKSLWCHKIQEQKAKVVN